jgi:hypothetical protein
LLVQIIKTSEFSHRATAIAELKNFTAIPLDVLKFGYFHTGEIVAPAPKVPGYDSPEQVIRSSRSEQGGRSSG